MLCNIKCRYLEYKYTGGSWSKIEDTLFPVVSNSINNMLSCMEHYVKLGGSMTVSHKLNRRFGLLVSKVVSVSICGTVRKIYFFNYDNARCVDDN